MTIKKRILALGGRVYSTEPQSGEGSPLDAAVRKQSLQAIGGVFSQKKLLRTLLAVTLIACACATKPAANTDEVSLNTAIRDAAQRMEARLDKGTKIALINFTSPSQAFSEYVLEELSSVLVNNGHLIVVDRANLDKLRQELGFNMSGEVSDKSMQAIGQTLGAQALVTGSLTSIDDLRRVMFKVMRYNTPPTSSMIEEYRLYSRRVELQSRLRITVRAVAHQAQAERRLNRRNRPRPFTKLET